MLVPMVTCNAAVLAIAIIYYAWRGTRPVECRPARTVNERVAHLLWAAAQQAA